MFFSWKPLTALQHPPTAINCGNLSQILTNALELVSFLGWPRSATSSTTYPPNKPFLLVTEFRPFTWFFQTIHMIFSNHSHDFLTVTGFHQALWIKLFITCVCWTIFSFSRSWKNSNLSPWKWISQGSRDKSNTYRRAEWGWYGYSRCEEKSSHGDKERNIMSLKNHSAWSWVKVPIYLWHINHNSLGYSLHSLPLVQRFFIVSCLRSCQSQGPGYINCFVDYPTIKFCSGKVKIIWMFWNKTYWQPTSMIKFLYYLRLSLFPTRFKPSNFNSSYRDKEKQTTAHKLPTSIYNYLHFSLSTF